jgi:lon-related putative ATP-dependent protease
MPGFRELKPEELSWRLDETTLGFKTTEELEDLKGTVGQQRALRALDFGLGIKSFGYNIYVMGQTGTGKMSTVMRALESKAKKGPGPRDWLYVKDFKNPEAPKVIQMPRGKGCELQTDMEELVERLMKAIPKAFDGEDFENRRHDIYTEHSKTTDAMLDKLNEQAHEKGFSLEKSQKGPILVPLKDDGKLMTQEEFADQEQAVKDAIEKTGNTLQKKLADILRQVRNMEKDLNEELKELTREFGLAAGGHMIDDLREKYNDYPKLREYFDDLKEDVLDHIDDFRQKPDMQAQAMMMMGPRPEPSFARYKANLLVNNCKVGGTPVVYEPNPTFPNLFGRIEQKMQFGMAVTDFTMIKAGALHRANGGYLVINALDLLRNQFSYEGLKRAIKNRTVSMEDAMESYRMVPLFTLKPEPVPLDVKIIIIGSPQIYYSLSQLDEEYRKLFKVHVDFESRMKRTDDRVAKYASYIAKRCKVEGLLPFDASGVARVVEYSARLTSDQEKLSTRFIDVADIVREASYWAEEDSAKNVGRKHVCKAIEEMKYRSAMVEERIREAMEEGIIKMDVEGEAVGQVNGLSVLTMGDYSFGRPSRITARTYMGRAGMVNVEREVKMSGPTHDKGVLIITGYIGHKYAKDKPLTLSASIAFEQNYGGIDGDSASSTELYALLSSLSGLPLKQGIAVTGSVNQNGEVQAIGGVNEKVEGHFEVCKILGKMDGSHGVMIPESNVRHLMLKDEVVDAVRAGKFHLWAASYIDGGIEVLTGVPAGKPGKDGKYPKDTVNRMVDDALRNLAVGLKDFGNGDGGDNGDDKKKKPAAAKKPAGGKKGK